MGGKLIKKNLMTTIERGESLIWSLEGILSGNLMIGFFFRFAATEYD